MTKPSFDYRYRFAIHAIIYMLGFWSYLVLPTEATQPWLTRKAVWEILPGYIYRTGFVSFGAAVEILLAIALVLLALGAWFRVWGSAYIGSSIVQSPAMHGETMLADGPYRHTRNPLYLGTILHTLGISVLMPTLGAAFTVPLIWAFQVRLALAEEPFLAAKFGQPYLDYKARVPRFLPMLAAQIPAAGLQPQWMQSILGELYFVGAFLVMAVFGWRFNATPVRQGILISLGVWLIVRALMPQAKTPEATTA